MSWHNLGPDHIHYNTSLRRTSCEYINRYYNYIIHTVNTVYTKNKIHHIIPLLCAWHIVANVRLYIYRSTKSQKVVPFMGDCLENLSFPLQLGPLSTQKLGHRFGLWPLMAKECRLPGDENTLDRHPKWHTQRTWKSSNLHWWNLAKTLGTLLLLELLLGRHMSSTC